MACVYQHKRGDNKSIFYIGIGRSIDRAYSRWSRGRVWNIVANKTDYTVDILLNDISWKDACSWEKYLIDLYGKIIDNNGPLSNICDGGGANPVLYGEMNGFYGKNHSEDSIKVMRQKAIERNSRPEFKAMLSKTHKGKKVTDEQRKKMSVAFSYDKNHKAKKVIDTITGEIYGCGKLAAEARGINYNTLRAMLNSSSKNNTSLIYLK